MLGELPTTEADPHTRRRGTHLEHPVEWGLCDPAEAAEPGAPAARSTARRTPGCPVRSHRSELPPPGCKCRRSRRGHPCRATRRRCTPGRTRCPGSPGRRRPRTWPSEIATPTRRWDSGLAVLDIEVLGNARSGPDQVWRSWSSAGFTQTARRARLLEGQRLTGIVEAKTLR